jgi:hypothetical protein
MADEVKINGVADDTFLVIATRPFPALVSYVRKFSNEVNLPKVILKCRILVQTKKIESAINFQLN